MLDFKIVLISWGYLQLNLIQYDRIIFYQLRNVFVCCKQIK